MARHSNLAGPSCCDALHSHSYSRIRKATTRSSQALRGHVLERCGTAHTRGLRSELVRRVQGFRNRQGFDMKSPIIAGLAFVALLGWRETVKNRLRAWLEANIRGELARHRRSRRSSM